MPATNLTLIHLPPYSPELDPVERVWEYLRDCRLSPGKRQRPVYGLKCSVRGAKDRESNLVRH